MLSRASWAGVKTEKSDRHLVHFVAIGSVGYVRSNGAFSDELRQPDRLCRRGSQRFCVLRYPTCARAGGAISPRYLVDRFGHFAGQLPRHLRRRARPEPEPRSFRQRKPDLPTRHLAGSLDFARCGLALHRSLSRCSWSCSRFGPESHSHRCSSAQPSNSCRALQRSRLCHKCHHPEPLGFRPARLRAGLRTVC